MLTPAPAFGTLCGLCGNKDGVLRDARAGRQVGVASFAFLDRHFGALPRHRHQEWTLAVAPRPSHKLSPRLFLLPKEKWQVRQTILRQLPREARLTKAVVRSV